MKSEEGGVLESPTRCPQSYVAWGFVSGRVGKRREDGEEGGGRKGTRLDQDISY